MENNSVDNKKPKRRLTNDDVLKYEAMVEKFIRDSVVKNWSEARLAGPEAFLGNSGYSLNDIRQHLRTEICVALQNYNPAYLTKDGRSVKESTFVFQHLTFRIGQMMKRLTKRRTGYGIRHNPFDMLIESGVEERSTHDLDLALSIDQRRELHVKNTPQVRQYLDKKNQG